MRLFFIIFLVSGLSSCITKKENDEDKTHLFYALDKATSNIKFENRIQENDQENWFTYEYFYNGGGVAIGDINNDGLADIYFSGNMTPDKLYLNKGNLKFEEITNSAIKQPKKGWNTGVSMADVNGDGYLDIYVCRAGPNKTTAEKSNLLYLNNGDLTFTESAKKFGIADTGLSTQASFFDYDLDGDLDVYVLNFPSGFFQLGGEELRKFYEERKNQSDRFYRNDNGKFTDVSYEVGINNHAFGLGISTGDINDDGYPDLYIANDYEERDYMFINHKGKFMEAVTQRTKHISNFGMGTDIADFNNDGYMDILETDMAFPSHVRSKRNMASMSTEKFWSLVKSGNHYQYMVNTLQLNNGNGTFSEIGQLAGVAKTDWSWGALFADLNLDGYKDITITNGYRRDMKDRDISTTLNKVAKEKGQKLSINEAHQFMPEEKVRNYLFKNNKDLTFTNSSENWGFLEKINSNGVAYGDLDNDGDLDLVINNIDEIASVYINTNNEEKNYLAFKLKGDQKNPFAVGARVKVVTTNGEQIQELFPTRGYQSSVDYKLIFGLDTLSQVQRVEVRWPNQKVSIIENVPTNQTLELSVTSAKPGKLTQKEYSPLFAFAADKVQLPYKHQENNFNDFDREILLPHMLSRLGPCIAVADVNGDGLDDIYFGGAKGFTGTLLLQNLDRTFSEKKIVLFDKHKNSEDVGALFFDFDKDGDKDLYVASGGNDFDANDKNLQDRLYVNDGKGNFKTIAKLPAMVSSTKIIKAHDFDRDGDLDLFVGGRLLPGKYPYATKSYLLQNNKGKWVDITKQLAPELVEVGMVTGAEFLDVDGDKDDDLAIVGEWMPLTLFINNGGIYDKEFIEDSEGLWQSLAKADVDGDGDDDLIAGNMGKNIKFKASSKKPFNIYCDDFDNNGTYDIVLSAYEGENHYPVRGKECSSQQMPFINEKFPTFKQFAEAKMDDIYGEKLQEALHLQVKELHSSLFINNNNGSFNLKHLPIGAQLSPSNAIIIDDVNNDGINDIIMSGNMYGAEVETVRYDAGRGVVLLGNDKGNFTALAPYESGMFAWGNTKGMAKIKIGSKEYYIITVNNAYPAVFEKLK